MTYASDLPDPDYDAQFYEGVPSKRLAAWGIDLAVILALTAGSMLAITILTLGFGILLFPMVFVSTSFLYRWITISRASATLGMRIMGIELRDSAGNRLSPGMAAAHSGIFVLLISTMLGGAANAISILMTRYNQGLHDLLLRTTAINRPLD